MRKHSTAGLYMLLLRDGTIHYIVLTALRVTNLVMFIRADVSPVVSLTCVYHALMKLS